MPPTDSGRSTTSPAGRSPAHPASARRPDLEPGRARHPATQTGPAGGRSASILGRGLYCRRPGHPPFAPVGLMVGRLQFALDSFREFGAGWGFVAGLAECSDAG
jgi:hypothetical protein